ncbi:MAG: hypothetical protein H6548_08885 [Chitinophagales bacterium]|nr:hypothetical protein [Chitinophagales bacterium]MCB9022221.1 hypothetical protein [Chitinophagales bacterium]HPE98014.1 PKD domain-containing protein [Chitinophagales bacterium]HQU75725.1 PKD domain-containing protein [Chitinophagales bacterium]HRX24175.1 PKD domain-containing protein [Chitinophagales bacterium]
MRLYVTGLLFSVLLCTGQLFAQQTRAALFLGNSYTYVNDLPKMIADVALTTGDTLIYDSNTPGGYTLQQHSTNATTLAMISTGAWDFVVLQEQSQLPSFPIEQVEVEVFPYAALLDSLISQANPCTETVFYMTWGRKNGDAMNCPFWPPVCTYTGMDDLLRERYEIMAADNQALVSPAGAVWRYIRETDPTIELYSADESHPSVAGTFATACAFYSVMFRKDPVLTSYDAGLDPVLASTIRAAASAVVFDSLDHWHVGEYDPVAAFSVWPGPEGHIETENLSEQADTWQWSMGDGTVYTDAEPAHTYAESGSYMVQLIASRGDCPGDTSEQTILVTVSEPNVVTNMIPGLSWVLSGNVLTLTTSTEAIRYRMLDSSGKVLTSGTIPAAGHLNLPLDEFAAGFCLLQLRSGRGQQIIPVPVH